MQRKRNFDQLQNEIQELFADLWQVPRFSGLRPGFRPQVDCYRTEEPKEITVLVELPGVDPETVEVVVADGALVVSGSRERPRCPGLVYQQMEMEYGPFRRQIPLGESVDVAAAHAACERGILKIVLPIAERRRPSERVAIEVLRG
jgi:HSP20 family protein